MRAEALGLGPDETLLAQQLADLLARLAGDDGQVQVLALQQLAGSFAVHFHLHQRVGLGETREDVRQKAHHIVVRRTDAHGADHVWLAQGVEYLAMQLEDAPRVAQQHLALGRKAHLAPITLEQGALHYVILQALHLHADG